METHDALRTENKRKIVRVQRLPAFVNLPYVVALAEKLAKENNLELKDFSLGHDFDYGEDHYHTLRYQTVETDTEYKKRLDDEMRYKENRRSMFEQLKEEFGY